MRAKLDAESLLYIILVLVVVWLVLEIVGELFSIVGILFGPLSSLFGLVIVVVIVLWLLDYI